MKKIFYLCLLVCLHTYTAFTQTKTENIAKLMKQYAAADQFNGVVLVAEKGKIIYQHAFGLADHEWNINNTIDTKFETASITKTFTALMIMQLAEKGKIDLNEKIAYYLKDYPKETGEKITLHQLLSHTSGLQRDIADFPSNENNFPDIVAKINEEFLNLEEQVALIGKRPILFEPGKEYSYSSDGYSLLGRILEVVCNKSYEEVLDSLISKPLGLINTGYKDHYSVLGKRATGYTQEYSGLKKAKQVGIAPSGGICSTVDDLLKWEQALYSDKLVTQRSKDILFEKTNRITNYGWKVTSNYFNTPGPDSIKVVKCTGALPGFNSLVVRFLKDNKTVVLLENVRRINYKQDDIVNAIANILYNKPFSLPKKSLAETLLTVVKKSGLTKAMELYNISKRNSSAYYLNEQEINAAGYYLLYTAKEPVDAIGFFKINTMEFPKSANAFDSLGEAYMINGDHKNAIESYKKSVELDPTNTNAQKMIEKMMKDQ